MKSCLQTEGMTVLDHGKSVARYYRDLINIIKNPNHEPKFNWKLPDWIFDPILINSILPLRETFVYQIFHDCGKPFCLEIDENGRRHFPNHAEISEQIWISLFGESDISWLIRHDMDIHLAKAKDAEYIASTKYWATQLLTGLAELHSNADMFGGIESTSFKIKYKAINKIGKNLLKLKNNQ